MIVRDVRFAVRSLAKNPGYTGIAVLTLALGIGACTGLFMVANTVLLRPLPYPDSDRLAIVQADFEAMGALRMPISPPELIDLRERSQSFVQIEAIWCTSGSLTGAQDPQQLAVAFVTGGFMQLLGVPPALGRAFTAQEDVPGGPAAVILSDALWRQRFAADPRILGSPIRLNGVERTVVGVMPNGFRLYFPRQASITPEVDAWVPLQSDLAASARGVRFLRAVARLRPDATLADARAELDMIAGQITSEHADYATAPIGFHTGDLQNDLVRPVRPAIVALMVGVCFLFLIACANHTNLLLVRAFARDQELAVRAAMGANRWSLVRHMLMENLVLAGAAGFLGFLVALWSLEALRPLMPATLALSNDWPIDFRVIVFVAVASLVLPSLCGILPVLRATELSLADSLKQGGRVSGSRGQQRLRSALIMGEIAMSLVLLIGAGLMIHTFIKLQSIEPGFRADGVLTFRVAPPLARYPSQRDRANFYQRLDRRLAALPGVEAVGGISHHPFFDGPNFAGAYMAGHMAADVWESLQADHRIVTPGYFKTVGARLLDGRSFADLDTAESGKVVVIDSRLARSAWPGESAVGKRLRYTLPLDGQFVGVWGEVIGVIEHMRSHTLREEGREQVYLPCNQGSRHPMTIAVRSSGSPERLAQAIRQEVAQIDAALPVYNVRPMAEYVAAAVTGERFTMTLACVFAVVALLLASAGIYGVISYSVSQRTHELGIRMALGARPGNILRQVLGQGVRCALVGVGAGLVIALSVTPFLGTLVFGVEPTDTTTFAVLTLFLVAVTVGSSYLPARRATRVSPMVALRCE